MQPSGCKAGWNTNFLLVITTKPISKKTYCQAVTNRNNTLIVRMRYNFQLAKSIKR